MRTAGQIKSIAKATAVRKERGYHKAAAAAGYVVSGEAFTSEAFIARLGITRSMFSEMRRRGLKARRDGLKRVMILADDYLKYLNEQPVAELDAAG